MTTSRQAAPDPDVAHVVLTVHGIRTFGRWQERLELLLTGGEAPDRRRTVINYKYGYFSAIAFAIPFFRWLLTRRFRRDLLQVAARYPSARLDVVAHSFGTHLVGWGLLGLTKPSSLRIDTLILAGSVLPSSFPWPEIIGARVRRLINDCGTSDGILLLSQLLVIQGGSAGRFGFTGSTSSCFRNRYFAFGHSGFFLEAKGPSDAFMREWWCPLLTGDGPIALSDARSERPLSGALTFCLRNATLIKVISYGLPAVLVPWKIWTVVEDRSAQQALAASRLVSTRALEAAAYDYAKALVISAEASSRNDSSETANTLLSVLMAQPHIVRMGRLAVPNIERDGYARAMAEGPPPAVLSVSRDGGLCAWWANGVIRLVGLKTQVDRYIAEPSRAIELVFSEDGQHLAWHNDRSLAISYNVPAAREEGRWRADGVVSAISYSASAQRLAIAGGSEVNIATLGGLPGDLELVGSVPEPAPGTPPLGVRFLVFDPTDKFLLSAPSQGNPVVWTLTHPGPPRVLAGRPSEPATAFAFDSGGRYVAGLFGNSIQAWTLNDFQPIGDQLVASGPPLQSLRFLDDGTLLSLDSSGGAIVWNITSRVRFGRTLARLPGIKPFHQVTLTSDSRVIGATSDILAQWDLTSGLPIGKPSPLSISTSRYMSVYALVAMNHKGTGVAYWDGDSRLAIWNTSARPTEARTLLLRAESSLSFLGFSQDDSVILATDSACRLYVVDPLRGVPAELPSHLSSLRVNSAMLASDGDTLVLGLCDGGVVFWSPKRPASTADRLPAHAAVVVDVVAGPSDLVATASMDGSVLIWNMKTRTVSDRCVTDRSPVTGIAFVSDRSFISTHSNGLVDWWDCRSQRHLGTLHPSDGYNRRISVDMAHQLVAVPERDGSISVLDLRVDVKKWILAACGIADRDLDPVEWESVFSFPVRRTCTGLRSGS
jgi:WD40 repeat protein